MPRGVYQRKSADVQAKPAAKKSPKAKTPRKASKPAEQRALVLTQDQSPPVLPPVATSNSGVPPGADLQSTPVTSVEPVEREEPIRGSVDDMNGDRLRRYARQIGVHQRDVDGLTEDRLRQNCKLMLFAAIEED